MRLNSQVLSVLIPLIRSIVLTRDGRRFTDAYCKSLNPFNQVNSFNSTPSNSFLQNKLQHWFRRLPRFFINKADFSVIFIIFAPVIYFINNSYKESQYWCSFNAFSHFHQVCEKLSYRISSFIYYKYILQNFKYVINYLMFTANSIFFHFFPIFVTSIKNQNKIFFFINRII